MPNLEDIRRALAIGPLASRAEALTALARPSVALRTTRVRQQELAPGESRIGGLPDLPPGTEWPRWKGEPQSFIAQIDLSRLDGLAAADPLPSEGRLAFFYSARQDTWGFSPADRGSSAVLHLPAGSELRRAAPPEPLPDGAAFEPCRLELSETWTLPSWDNPGVASLGLTDAEADAYCDVGDAVHGEDAHRLLGHPDPIQGEMTVECQLVTHGLDLGDGAAWSDPRAEALAEGWSEWRLLLQVASDDAPRTMWGDAGCIYYWIRTSDLAARDFARTWLILQCY